MPAEFSQTHRVEFADTDLAGIMHFANFFRLMERTEHAFLRSLGWSVHQTEGGRTLGWPRVHVECDYRRPLRFEDEVEVRLRVREKRERSLTYDFTFHLPDSPEQPAATGSVTAVCVELDRAAGVLKSVPIPAALADQIEVAPE
jgi:acyl-CoA thioester hydrolase